MTYKPATEKERIAHRLKIVQGHLKKVAAMVKADAYCIDILHQSQAVIKGLSETNNLILEHHLKTCATDAIRHGRPEDAINEIMEIIKKKT